LRDVHVKCYVHDVVNVVHNVNIDQISAADLESRLADVLRVLLSRVQWLRGWTVKCNAPGRYSGWDITAAGQLPGGGTAALCVECKLHLQPSQFGSLADRPCEANQLGHTGRVLAMPCVSPRMASLCQEHGWSWLDLAGNCHLEIPGAILIERLGHEPIRIHERPVANLRTSEAARVVRALLAPENAGKRWTQREMAAHFGTLAVPVPAPSLALVNKVVQHLRIQAFLELLPNRGFRVHDYEGLLLAWRQAYRFDRSARRRYFTLLQGRALHEKLRALDPNNQGRLAYAAFSAADFQAPHVRQPRTWLYLATADMEEEFKATIEAKSVDSGENLVVLIPTDPGIFYRLDAGKQRLACTNSVQTYIDLVHAGGRGEEAGEAVLQQRLKPAWSEAKE
jgi:hypothetical protein